MDKHPISLPWGVCFTGAQNFPGRSGVAHPVGILYCLPFLPGLPSPLSYLHLPNKLLLNKILFQGAFLGNSTRRLISRGLQGSRPGQELGGSQVEYLNPWGS